MIIVLPEESLYYRPSVRYHVRMNTTQLRQRQDLSQHLHFLHTAAAEATGAHLDDLLRQINETIAAWKAAR